MERTTSSSRGLLLRVVDGVFNLVGGLVDLVADLLGGFVDVLAGARSAGPSAGWQAATASEQAATKMKTELRAVNMVFPEGL